MDTGRKLVAEFPGTLWLVFAGCGAAVLAASFEPTTNPGIGLPSVSTGPGLFVGGWAMEQLWMFWVAPLLGAPIAGGIHRTVLAAPAGAEAGVPAA